MVRKLGGMYHSIKQQTFSRREYMGGVPTSRFTQFVTRNKSSVFPVQLYLLAIESGQIRRTPLKSAHITVNRAFEKNAEINDYRLNVRVYPHHVLRENKQATGVGADRLSQGMRASFRGTVETAVWVQPNQIIMSVETLERDIAYARYALKKASSLLPTPCKIKFAS